MDKYQRQYCEHLRDPYNILLHSSIQHYKKVYDFLPQSLPDKWQDRPLASISFLTDYSLVTLSFSAVCSEYWQQHWITINKYINIRKTPV